ERQPCWPSTIIIHAPAQAGGAKGGQAAGGVLTDDGFTIYLNHTLVAQFNMTSPITWDSTAAISLEAEPGFYETFDLTPFKDLLLPGENVLAVHAVNTDAGSADFLIQTELASIRHPAYAVIDPATPLEVPANTGLVLRALIDPYNDIENDASIRTRWAVIQTPPDGTAEVHRQGEDGWIAFGGTGFYRIRLTASVGPLETHQDFEIEVTAQFDGAGVPVNAGTDQQLDTLATSVQGFIALVNNDPLTFLWEQVSGPGEVLFLSADQLQSTVVFSTPGDYRLRLSVDNGTTTTFDDVAIEVSMIEIDLIDESAPLHWFVPRDDQFDALWRDPGFNDFEWEKGVNRIGYDRSTDFLPLIQTTVESRMYNQNASLYLRYPFFIPAADEVSDLTLFIRGEDGFVAYLNGTEVHRFNAPEANLGWGSEAPVSVEESRALQFQEVDLQPYQRSLLDGVNVLAVHALNTRPNSSDLLLETRLSARWWDNDNEDSLPAIIPKTLTNLTPTGATIDIFLPGTIRDETRVTTYWGAFDAGENSLRWEHQATDFSETFLDGVLRRTLTDLLPGTRYFLRWQATNDSGSTWAPFGIQFTTPDETPDEVYQSWIATFPDLTPDERAPLFDIDNDGLTNLAEFALAGHPLVSDSGQTEPRIELSSDGLVLVFRQRRDAVNAGLHYELERSPSLGEDDWEMIEPDGPIERELDANGLTQSTFVPLPTDEADRFFYRLRIVLD
ncbi:MAG: hypothetical protein AAF514_06070, partial [Verrucomicrobiota bacterium]